jgi:hypothetical protein
MKPLAAASLAAASLAAVMAAGATYAVAQGGPGRDGPRYERGDRPDFERQERFIQEDLPALTDARIAGLKAGLRLNAEQERLWGPVEGALRDMAALRTERMNMMRERRAQGSDVRGSDAKGSDANRPDLMERLDRMADGSRKSADALGKLRDAAKPLYATFDERQKRLLPVLIGGRHGMMAGGHRGHWRDHHERGGHRDRFGQGPRGDWDNGPRGERNSSPRGERL